MGNYTRNLILINVGVAVVGIGLGVIIGYFSHPDSTEPSWTDTVRKQLRDIDPDAIPKYIEQVSPDNLRENLQYLAEKPHMATTSRDDELAEYINEKWTEYLDESRLVSYDILLSFPSDDPDKPNVATAFNGNGSVAFKTRTTEIVLEGGVMQSSETIVPYFNAFAPKGTVKGKLVYANFGSEDDFEYLASQGVDLNGTIALTKYGRVGRGARTFNAKPYGVIGVLVYSDPENYATDGDVGYPDDWSISGTAVQRGSSKQGAGDPSTTGYPSIKSAYRIPSEKIDIFPATPLQPIAYEDAERLIQMLDSSVPPGPEWSTGLNNKVLNIGPGFADGGELELSVNNELKYVSSKNVIGKIRGETEPDDWVMYGNHRDAWVYGAVDPSSGTACLLEMTRIMGNLLKDGWRPKRSMMFGSWGAEEFGLIGSIEWTEENSLLLSERSVSYINVDIAVFGNSTFNAAASRTMSKLLRNAASKVPDPIDASKTALDTWTQFMPDPSDSSIPNVKGLTSGSDFVPFYHSLGITSADLSYRSDPNDESRRISPYPTYHTAYDTFDYVDRFMDPGFIAHATICKVAGTAMILLADSLIIPFDPRDMAAYVTKQINGVEKYSGVLNGTKIDYLKEAGSSLAKSANDLMTYTENTLDRTNLAKIAEVNRRLRLFERSFIEPAALPGEVTYKHISGYPAENNGGSFTSIDVILYENNSPSEDDLDLAHQQLAMITYRILNAANSLLL